MNIGWIGLGKLGAPIAGDVNVIVTAHERYRTIRWPVGSCVLDPFGIIADQEGVTVKRIGRR